MHGLRSALLPLLVCAGLFATSASGDTLYAVFGNSFGTLDPTTGNFTTLGASPNVIGMGFAPNGTMYATEFGPGVDQVDPSSGNLTPLFSTLYSAGGSTVGSDGLIYAFNQDFSNVNFYSINPVSQAVILISSGLGFASDGLAVFANGLDTLESVNPVTGATTQIGTGFGLNSGAPIQIFAGANINGTIYAGGPVSDGNLYTINLTGPLAGRATLDVATNGGDDLFALASVPEPSTATLAGAGIALIGLVVTVRRRRPKSSSSLS
jgi:hypothetical protein